jgi:hypothetical protein
VDSGDLERFAATVGADQPDVLADALPVLTAWRRRRGGRQLSDAWRYRAVWRPLTTSVDVSRAPWAPVDGTGDESSLWREALGDPVADASTIVAPVGSIEAAVRVIQDVGARSTVTTLWLVTSGAVSPGADPVREPLQAALWGIGRSAALDYPHLRVGLLDLDDTADPRALAQAIDAGEVEVVVRGAQVYVRRLVRAPRGTGQPWEPRGAVRVINPGTETGRHVTDRFRADADEPVSAAVYVAPEREPRSLVDEAPAEFAAAVHEEIRAIDEIVRAGLDVVLLFSSVAGTWGAAGRAGLAAVDAYAAAIADPAANVASLDWTPWTQDEPVRRHGLASLDPAQAMEAARAAVGDGALVIVDVDWDAFAPAFRASRHSRLLDELVPPEATAAPAAELRDRLAGQSRAEGRRILLGLVRTHVAAVLGQTGIDAVSPDRSLRDLGFDSLAAVRLRDRLATATGLTLAPTLVFDHPDAGALADHLAGEFALEPAATDLDAQIDGLRAALGSAPDPARAVERLEALLAEFGGGGRGVVARRVAEADDDELFAFIDKELGV